MVERGGPLPVREALQAMRGTLRALAYAHAQGIVHRDVKPENIMVTPEGQVKVTDFGLAMARGDVRLTQEGMIIGTMMYMAPELVHGEPADSRSDLYAVGAVLYELLTGQPPFTGGEQFAILTQVINSPVTPPRALDPSLSPAVEALILKLLSKDPADRCASAEETLAALPDPAEADPSTSRRVNAVAQAEPATAERASLSLVEGIIRSSTASHPKPATPDEETLLALPESAGAAPLQQELLLYAALEDTASAVEAERRRLAQLLQSRVIESLNLLLSQANVYEQTLGANPNARMAVSVLSSLARQVLQQIRDLEAALHPTLLETLGLEPALESLASQLMRAHGVQIALTMERMRERLPTPVELALFRAAQDALERAIQQGHASQATIRLERREDRLAFTLADNGMGGSGIEALRDARQRIESLGGVFETRANPHGGFELAIRFSIEAPAQLTSREVEVLQLLAEGMSNKEIAQALVITPRTVNFHLDNIYSKLGVSSRTEAAIYALRHGLARTGRAR
jgi:signal transduction histidine kinase/DNA-binding CsgD family transcriptional regulator